MLVTALASQCLIVQTANSFLLYTAPSRVAQQMPDFSITTTIGGANGSFKSSPETPAKEAWMANGDRDESAVPRYKYLFP